MCLSKITATYDKPSSLIVDGRKEFSGKLGSFKYINMGGAVQMDTWIKASDLKKPVGITAGDGKTYMAGFHAYFDEKEVKRFLHFHRVYLRNITCAGDEAGMKCVIAQEMYVPSDPNAWPPQETSPTPAKKAKRFFKGGVN